MAELILYWSKQSMSEETPKEFEGKNGIFAITHKSEMIYIGMAAGSKYHVFQESKRIGKCADLLQKHGILSESLSYDERWKYASENCQRYVGVVSEEVQCSNQLTWLLRNGENLLIYEVNKKIPLYNRKLKKKYLYDRPFSVRNNGEKPNGMETHYYARVETI